MLSVACADRLELKAKGTYVDWGMVGRGRGGVGGAAGGGVTPYSKSRLVAMEEEGVMAGPAEDEEGSEGNTELIDEVVRGW